MDRPQHQIEITLTSKKALPITEVCCMRRLAELIDAYRTLYMGLGGQDFSVSHVVAEDKTHVTLVLAVDDPNIGTAFMQAINALHHRAGSTWSPDRN